MVCWRLVCVPLVAVAACAQPVFQQTDVFRAGAEGYHTFRIPAIVAAADGSLVAFAEARKENQSDPGGGDIDLVSKRSSNGGLTWSALQLVDDPGERWGASNPTPVLDRSKGRLWILFNRWEPGFGTERSQPGASNNQAWARYSDDHGRSWSAPRDLTRFARDYDNWGAMFLGPGGAIQTQSGRLLVPAAMRPDTYRLWIATPGFDGPALLMRAYAFYSDDHGATWRRGQLLKAQTDENQLVELADGAILMDARQGMGPHRWLGFSHDGGQSWSNPLAGQEVTPICAAIERWTLASGSDGRNRILWTGPAGPARKRLVARISYDEGQTFAAEKDIYGGLAAYSDIAILRDGTAGVLWERGVSAGYQYITFTRFDLAFVETPR